MLAIGAVVLLVSTIFEIMIVHHLRPEKFQSGVNNILSKPLYRLGPFLERSMLNSLMFSLAVSLAIGAMFPAAGVAVLIGGIGSTIATQPYYSARRIHTRITRMGRPPAHK